MVPKKDLLIQTASEAKSDLKWDHIVILAEPLFYVERRTYTKQVDCRGALIAPGLIDIQVQSNPLKGSLDDG